MLFIHLASAGWLKRRKVAWPRQMVQPAGRGGVSSLGVSAARGQPAGHPRVALGRGETGAGEGRPGGSAWPCHAPRGGSEPRRQQRLRAGLKNPGHSTTGCSISRSHSWGLGLGAAARQRELAVLQRRRQLQTRQLLSTAGERCCSAQTGSFRREGGGGGMQGGKPGCTAQGNRQQRLQPVTAERRRWMQLKAPQWGNAANTCPARGCKRSLGSKDNGIRQPRCQSPTPSPGCLGAGSTPPLQPVLLLLGSPVLAEHGCCRHTPL